MASLIYAIIVIAVVLMFQKDSTSTIVILTGLIYVALGTIIDKLDKTIKENKHV